MEESNKPLETNPSEEHEEPIEEVLDDISEEAGSEHVEEEGDEKNQEPSLTLDKLNELAGRKGDRAFESIEAFQKHYGELKNFVGKPKETSKKDDSDVKSELQELKKDLARKDFVIANPDLKDYVDVIEAYAEKKGMTLEEAGKADKFQNIANISKERGKQIISKTRINPVQSQRISQLVKQAREGNSDAQEALVMETIWKK